MADYIDRMLNSIGKRTFVRCHDTATRRGDSFTVDDMLHCDPDLEGTRPTAQATRASKIRTLIREGLGHTALSRCQGHRR